MSKERYLEYKEIKDILEEQMTQFEAINDEIIDNQNDFEKIRENYNKYNNLINKGKSHVSDLERRELYIFLFVYSSYFFFWGCVIFVIYQRFPIHKMIFFIFNLFYRIIKLIIPSKTEGNIVMYHNITSSNISNISMYDNITGLNI